MHVAHFVEFGLGVCCDELLDYHESAADTDDELSVHDLGKNFLGAEQIVAVTETFDWNGTLCHVDVFR